MEDAINEDIYTITRNFNRLLDMAIENLELDYSGRPQIKNGSPIPAICQFFKEKEYAKKIQELKVEKEKDK